MILAHKKTIKNIEIALECWLALPLQHFVVAINNDHGTIRAGIYNDVIWMLEDSLSFRIEPEFQMNIQEVVADTIKRIYPKGSVEFE